MLRKNMLPSSSGLKWIKLMVVLCNACAVHWAWQKSRSFGWCDVPTNAFPNLHVQFTLSCTFLLMLSIPDIPVPKSSHSSSFIPSLLFFVVSKPAQASGLRWDVAFYFLFQVGLIGLETSCLARSRGTLVLAFVSSTILTVMIIMIMKIMSAQLLSPQCSPLQNKC